MWGCGEKTDLLPHVDISLSERRMLATLFHVRDMSSAVWIFLLIAAVTHARTFAYMLMRQ